MQAKIQRYNFALFKPFNVVKYGVTFYFYE